MTPDQYCAERANAGSADAHYSLLFATPEARRGALAVHAFVRETGEIAEETHDAGVAQTKLDWWCEEIERLYRGEPRHPVARALAPVIAARALEREHFFTLLGETARTAGSVRFTDAGELHEHCRHAGATSALLLARVLDPSYQALHTGIETLGTALRLTDILMHLGQDVRRDRLFLPLDALSRFGVEPDDVLACRHTPAFAELMAFETEHALHQLDDALLALPVTDRRKQLPSLILARLARALLEELRRDGYRALERRVVLTPLRKYWIAWRTRLAESGPH